MKDPITSRDVFYDTLRDGSLFFLDWCLVDTPLGAMVEPRQIMGTNPEGVTNTSLYDSSFSRVSQFDEDTFYSTFGTGGRQLPADYSAY